MADAVSNDSGILRSSRYKWLRWFTSHPWTTIALYLCSTAATYYFAVCRGTTAEGLPLSPIRIAATVGLMES